MVRCFAGTLFAIVSFMLSLDAGRALILKTVSPPPFFLESPTNTCEFAVIIEEFTNKQLYLDIYYNNTEMVSSHILNLNWSAHVSTSSKIDVWTGRSRWYTIQIADNETIKSYLIRIMNVTVEDAGLYSLHAKQQSGTLGLMDSVIKNIPIDIQGISIDLLVWRYH